MSVTAVDGVVAAGHVPTWIIPAASLVTEPTEATWSIPLSALTGGTTVKADCHMDMGDLSITRSANTKSRQRMCQIVAETVKVGETIDIELSSVFDQQQAGTVAINKVYAALPEKAVVFIAQAFGWDSATAPTASTKIDLYKATVQFRSKNQPTSLDEDLKFKATLSGSAYWQDVALTGP